MDVFKYYSIQYRKELFFPNDPSFVLRDAWISYQEVLEKISESNCILEILQEKQKTQSIRYFEAVAYNKKLLTNNPNIFSLPFYDKRYMRYFESIQEIDFDWIRSKEVPNYNYQGEFSPKKMLQQVLFDQKVHL